MKRKRPASPTEENGKLVVLAQDSVDAVDTDLNVSVFSPDLKLCSTPKKSGDVDTALSPTIPWSASVIESTPQAGDVQGKSNNPQAATTHLALATVNTPVQGPPSSSSLVDVSAVVTPGRFQDPPSISTDAETTMTAPSKEATVSTQNITVSS